MPAASLPTRGRRRCFMTSISPVPDSARSFSCTICPVRKKHIAPRCGAATTYFTFYKYVTPSGERIFHIFGRLGIVHCRPQNDLPLNTPGMKQFPGLPAGELGTDLSVETNLDRFLLTDDVALHRSQ